MTDIPQAIAAVEAALAAEREAANGYSHKDGTIADFYLYEAASRELTAAFREHAPALLAAAKESSAKDAEIERLRARIEVLEDAADLALDKLEYLMGLWGAEAITRRVADKLRDARYPVDAGRPPSE